MAGAKRRKLRMSKWKIRVVITSGSLMKTANSNITLSRGKTPSLKRCTSTSKIYRSKTSLISRPTKNRIKDSTGGSTSTLFSTMRTGVPRTTKAFKEGREPIVTRYRSAITFLSRNQTMKWSSFKSYTEVFLRCLRMLRMKQPDLCIKKREPFVFVN